MSPRAEPPSDGVDLWLHEHEARAGGPWWCGLKVPCESILGGTFLVWGTLLLIVLVFDLLSGVFLLFTHPALRRWYVASLALAAIGSWLAFELSSEEGFDVSREWSPSALSDEPEPRKT